MGACCAIVKVAPTAVSTSESISAQSILVFILILFAAKNSPIAILPFTSMDTLTVTMAFPSGAPGYFTINLTRPEKYDGMIEHPGPAFYLLVSTTCVACSVASCSVTENPSAGRSMPVSSASP